MARRYHILSVMPFVLLVLLGIATIGIGCLLVGPDRVIAFMRRLGLDNVRTSLPAIIIIGIPALITVRVHIWLSASRPSETWRAPTSS
jgi:hypothetical protein